MDPVSAASAALKAADTGNRLWSSSATILSALTVAGWCVYGVDGRPGEVVQEVLTFLGAPVQPVLDVHAWLTDPTRRDTLVKVAAACLAVVLLRTVFLRWEDAHEFDDFMHRPARPEPPGFSGAIPSDWPEVTAAWDRSNKKRTRAYIEMSDYLSHRFFASWATIWILVALLAECGAVNLTGVSAVVVGYLATLFLGALVAYGGLYGGGTFFIRGEIVTIAVAVAAIPLLWVVRVVQFSTGEFSWRPRPRSSD